MMKIGIDVSQIVYRGTGISTYTRYLVKSLLKEDTKNAYLLFGSSLRQNSDLQEFFETLGSKKFSRRTLFLPPTLLDIMWNRLHIVPAEFFVGSVDIFHSSDWTQPPTSAKKVTTIHDLIILRYPEYFDKKIIEVQKRRLSWITKECDAVIVDSYATKEDVKQFLSIEERKIHVIHLGVDPHFIPQDAKKVHEVRKKYNLPNDYIVSVGTIEPRKNLKRTLQAFSKIQKNIPHKLVLVGKKGWGEELPYMDSVIATGFVPLSDLPALYTGAMCFVYPSLYEGFGLPVLEALSCGCPVVCSNKGSLKEIMGKAPFVVNPEEVDDIAHKIKKAAMLSENEYMQRVQEGMNHAKEFTWKKTAKKTVQVYQSLI